MEKKTKATGIIFLVLALIAVIVLLGLSVIDVFSVFKEGTIKYTVGTTLQIIVWIAVIIEAFIYFAKGGRKDEAPFFKAFSWTYLVSSLCCMVLFVCALAGTRPFPLQGKQYLSGIIFILWSVSFAIALILAYGLNLGKRKSFILVIIAIISTLLYTVLSFYDGVALKAVLNGVLDGLIRVLLLAVYYLIVAAKYEDKAARNTD